MNMLIIYYFIHKDKLYRPEFPPGINVSSSGDFSE